MKIHTIEIGGQQRPIHFGLWALKRISKELDINAADLLGGAIVTDLDKTLGIIRIGLQEGEETKAERFGTAPDPWAINLTDKRLSQYFDERPEAMEEGFNLYLLQAFGKTQSEIIAALEKQAADSKSFTPDEIAEKTKALEASKNAWAKLQDTVSRLASIDLPKLA